jgi:hypothetical protein
MLTTISLQDEDVPAGAAISLLPGGDKVAGQVTLDLCGADFPSEARRAARLQEVAKDSAGVSIVSDENVLYKSAGDAKQALDEVRAVIAGCDPSALVPSKVSSVPPLHYQLDVLPDTRLDGLTADHIAFVATLKSEQGQTKIVTIVYQRRGPFLVGLYANATDQVISFARLVATKLAALPESAVAD